MRKGKLVCLGIESTAHTFGVAVVTEKGESGGFTAAPIAKKVFSKWKEKYYISETQ